ncbi:GntR family transcriptional regulator [Streptomyces sp. Ncost-T10-10d]|uniref:GntR family transcriptional regulator n=1 Tax=Streptomyces sp. Ncost-T10-10d TaxID=1839774 RepID=UPI000A74A032
MRPSSYKAVVHEFAAAIRSGAIPVGTRFPTHRALAREWRIALATATRVYAELAALGLVVGEPGRGPFVRVRSGYEGLEPPRTLPVPRIDGPVVQPAPGPRAGRPTAARPAHHGDVGRRRGR